MTEERKLVSLLFADVVDSTAMGASHDPELVRGVMGRYFARMKDVAETHGGTVEKFIGDAIMVVFGVPRLHEDDAERAVRAALAMLEAMVNLNQDSRVGLALRIGVNSGEVVAGLGDDRQFLVTGDAVNVAARLQQGAEAGEVVVGALTARLTRDAIEYEPREPIIAKGKTEPLTSFRALRAHSARPATHGRAPAPGVAFVGRERELRQLLDMFKRAQDERTGHLVTIVGNAGVGKSRLVAEALARLAQLSDVHILRGRCLPYGAGIIYWPLMDVIREDAGIAPLDDRAGALAKVGARLAALVSADRLPLVLARVAVLLGLEAPAAALPTVPAERIAVELSWGIRQYLEAIAARGPLVVVIDDLQWADPAALDVLEQLADRSSAVPFLLVCLARPEQLERSASWPAGTAVGLVLVLEPLDATDTQTLVERLLGKADVTPLVGSSVAERSAGNPLFCEEFVRMLVEAQSPERAEGRVSGTRSAPDLPLPETIMSVVAARMDGLTPAEKACLQRASVIGEQFAVDDLLALDSKVGAAPEALLRKGFFVADRDDPSGRSFRFKHLLMRDVAYGSLPKADRAALHDRVGSALEAQMSDRRDEFCELLAYHAAQSYLMSRDLGLEGAGADGRAERALRWSGLAGDRALAVYATEHAADHYGLAIEIGLREECDSALLEHLYTGRGRALELRGAYDAAIQTYEAFERLAAQRGDDRLRADALARQATIYRTPTTLFDPDRADLLVEAALRVARQLDDPTLISELQRDRIHIQLHRGHVDAAIEVGEESLAAATASGSRQQLMYTYNDIVCAYREAGMFEEGRESAIRASALAEEIGDTAMTVNAIAARGSLEFVVGDYDTSLRLSEEAIALAKSIDNAWGQANSLGCSAWPLFERGDFGAAITAMEESLRLAAEVGFLVPAFLYEGDLAWYYWSAGADEESHRHLEAARAAVEAHFPSMGALLLGHHSRAATALGATDLAAQYLDRAREALATRTGEYFPFQHAHVGLAAVELKLALRDLDGAAAEARAQGDEQRKLMRPYVADFEYLEGEADRLRGEFDLAADALARARASASTLGGRRILWRILASLGSVEDARGNASTAAAAYDEARAIAAGIEDSLRPVGLADSFRERVVEPQFPRTTPRPVDG